METLGAIFSNFDIRDYKAKIDKAITKNLGESYELPIVRVKNQGSVGSCCAHVLSSVVEYFNYIQHNIKTEMSVGYIYGNRTNTTHKGKGMIVRDALKMLREYGTVTKESFPYNVEVPEAINKFNNCYNELHDEGVVSRISSYYRVKTENEIKSALKLKYPVVIAIEWYSDMKVINGILTTKYKRKRGGHCMLLYGWNKKGWKVLNSWGRIWGVNGTCIIPYDMPIREAWAVVDNIKDGVVLKKPLSSSTGKQMANVINAFGNISKQIDSKIDVKTLSKRINSKINNVAKKILSQ